MYTFSSNYRDYVMGTYAKVPLANGSTATGINFDNAATTPPLVSVIQGIVNFSQWYSSIHRGTGYKSQLSSELYENSRNIVAEFVKADPKENVVIYVKNTTEAINKLANRLCDKNRKDVILSTCMEHHSNDLPWRNKFRVDYVEVDSMGRLSMHDLRRKLARYRGDVKLVTITGASNVTGNTNSIHEAARLAHKYGAMIMVDGAQLVPHAPIDMKPMDSPEHIDYLVFSAHKMYAPFGIGVLIGPKSSFEKGAPDYAGGGTVDIVTHDYIKWLSPPEKDEAGTPNVMGVVALIEAIKTLNSIGMPNIHKYEMELTRYALDGLKSIPGIELYGNTENCDNRVSIIPFNIKDMPHSMTAEILSHEAGIAVRNGCFCAQPYVQRLLHVSRNEMRKRRKNPKMLRPGMVRLSFGMYNTPDEVDVLLNLLNTVVKNKDLYMKRYKHTIE